MPIHDWTRVDAGIFHHFHGRWIFAITDALNLRILPREYYALAEKQGAGFVPNILTLKWNGPAESDDASEPSLTQGSGQGEANGSGAGGVLVAAPRVRVLAETDLEFYRRKQNVAAVRRASDNSLVAVVEIVSKGNKSGNRAFKDFVRKAADFLSHEVHLMILDLQPPTAPDPQGIHGVIWDEVAGEEYARPGDKPLTLAAYEAATGVRAFVEPVAVGDPLIDMPLFLEPGRYVAVPLEETYSLAFGYVPRRWRTLLEPR